jgi:hypothetical protein
MPIILVVAYLFTELVGYLINPKINHDMRKPTQTPLDIKNKKNSFDSETPRNLILITTFKVFF